MVRNQRTELTQTATTETTIRVSQQQVLDAQLLELGDDELMRRIDDELNGNSALEEGRDDDDELDGEGHADEPMDGSGDKFDDLSGFYNDDNEELPVYTPTTGDSSRTEIPVGDTRSFVEELRDQIGDHDLESEEQKELVEYLIGSLDNNGFIDRPLASISDDLLFHHNIDASVEDLERALKVLQDFDPAGIGARNLQECMRIQLQRKIDNMPVAGHLSRLNNLGLALEVVDRHFDLFRRNEQEKLREKLAITADEFHDVMEELARLNPRPGLSLNEGAADSAQTIVPDFIIETTVDGDITFSLRSSRIPQLRVNRTYQEMVDKADTTKMTQAQKEDLRYLKGNVTEAQMFINAIRKRQDTLYRTMRVIIAKQREFMLTQDDTQLLPLTGGEVARLVGVDGSTISRAISTRYALLDGTLYPLKAFFLRTRQNASGEEVLRTQVESALQEIIDGEDKTNPLSDRALAEALVARGLNIQRRTVAKYREQMNIPTASMRRSLRN